MTDTNHIEAMPVLFRAVRAVFSKSTGLEEVKPGLTSCALIDLQSLGEFASLGAVSKYSDDLPDIKLALSTIKGSYHLQPGDAKTIRALRKEFVRARKALLDGE